MANRFQTALDEALQEMLEKQDGARDFCMAVYEDSLSEDNALVMFMELGKYAGMHEVMAELYSCLSKRLGYPVRLCHNHPTDEKVLIFGSKQDSGLYDAKECCKKDITKACMHFLENNEGYRPEIQAVARGAAAYASICGMTVEEVLESLNWDEDPQTQLLNLFVTTYKATTA